VVGRVDTGTGVADTVKVTTVAPGVVVVSVPPPTPPPTDVVTVAGRMVDVSSLRTRPAAERACFHAFTAPSTAARGCGRTPPEADVDAPRRIAPRAVHMHARAPIAPTAFRLASEPMMRVTAVTPEPRLASSEFMHAYARARRKEFSVRLPFSGEGWPGTAADERHPRRLSTEMRELLAARCAVRIEDSVRPPAELWPTRLSVRFGHAPLVHPETSVNAGFFDFPS
jgi:hypothetical protein